MTLRPADSAQAAKPIRIGIIGIGVGATQIMPQMDALPEFEIVAGADTNPRVRRAFQSRYEEAKVYESAEGLCAEADVSAERLWPSRLLA